MNEADFAATAPWGGLAGKPDTFPPSAHKHALADIERNGAKLGDVATWTGKRWEPAANGLAKFRIESDAGFAAIKEEIELIASTTESLSQKTTTLSVGLSGATADIEQRFTTLANVDSASAKSIIALSARFDESLSRLSRTDEVNSTAISALSRSTTELSSTLGRATANISSVFSTYATKTFAEAKRVDAIRASIAYVDGELVTLSADIELVYATKVQADGYAEARKTEAITASATYTDTAKAAAISTAASDATTKAAAAQAAAAVYASAQATLAQTTAEAYADGVVTAEEADRIAADTVAVATASADATTKANAAQAAAEAYADAEVAVINANITTNYATKAYADGTASAEASTALTAANAYADGEVATEASLRISAVGAIHAQWGVRLNVDGRVIGRINLDGTNETSTLDFEADSIRMWNGTAAVAPFDLSGGIVRLVNATVAGSLDIGTGTNRTQITSGGLTVGLIQITGATNQNTMLMGAGQIYQVSMTAGVAACAVSVGTTSVRTVISDLGILWAGSGSPDTILKRTAAGILQTDGQLVVVGALTTDGVVGRRGQGGATGNILNNYWFGSTLEAWVDVTHVGDYLFAGAHTASTVTHSGYMELKDSSGVTRKVMIGT